ncbi:MAG: hypothetical protein HQL54_02200 [Magnetococcales bacterium]|nr:hypothetical protein [Magnetococcales bacterium]
MILSIVTIGIMLTLGMALFRAIRGPTIYDRILAVNMFGTTTVVFIGVYGYLTGRPDFLDIAIIYAGINFIGTLAVVKFVTYNHLGAPHYEDDIGDM